jgi:hypothetical protein
MNKKRRKMIPRRVSFFLKIFVLKEKDDGVLLARSGAARDFLSK